MRQIAEKAVQVMASSLGVVGKIESKLDSSFSLKTALFSYQIGDLLGTVFVNNDLSIVVAVRQHSNNGRAFVGVFRVDIEGNIVEIKPKDELDEESKEEATWQL